MHLRSARVIGLLFAFLSVFFLFRVSVANAQTVSSSTQTYTATPQNSSSVSPDVPRNQHTHVQITLIEIMSALTCQLVGIDPITPTKGCLGIDPTTQKIGYTQQTTDGGPKVGGAIGAMTGMIAMTYTPPASSVDYFRHLANNFGFPKANAQSLEQGGYGFAALGPIMGVYEITRNIAYLLFALAMVVIGVAIMFRVKIDPRTVMSIQNQIPKIIIGLILITFSYAIVGFLVDMMWVTTYASINILTDAKKTTEVGERVAIFNTDVPPDNDGDGQADGESEKQAVTSNVTNNPIGFTRYVLEFDLIPQVGGAIGTLISEVVSTTSGLDRLRDTPCGVAGFGEEGGQIQGCIGEVLYGTVFLIASLIGIIIVALALFIVLFRIWFMLIKAFAMVVLATMSAPLWMVAGLFPGSKVSFGGWLRQIIANLAVFPATVIMLLLAKISLESFKVGSAYSASVSPGIFIPPLVGNLNVAEGFGSILAFGIILMIPDLNSMLRDALKSPPSQYGGNFRSRLMAGNPLSAAPGLGQMGYTMHNIKNAPVVGGIFKHFSGEGRTQ